MRGGRKQEGGCEGACEVQGETFERRKGQMKEERLRERGTGDQKAFESAPSTQT